MSKIVFSSAMTKTRNLSNVHTENAVLYSHRVFAISQLVDEQFENWNCAPRTRNSDAAPAAADYMYNFYLEGCKRLISLR